jgi:hypothetical protein
MHLVRRLVRAFSPNALAEALVNIVEVRRVVGAETTSRILESTVTVCEEYHMMPNCQNASSEMHP